MTTFDIAVGHVFKAEGGLVDHPSDPGGLTNMGISLRAYPHLGADGIRNMTTTRARAIYRADYWQPLDADHLDPRLAVMAFDAAVNHGLSRAKRWLTDYPTIHEFTAHRLRFYARLSTFTSFGRGWMNRMASVIELLATLPNPLLPVATLHVTGRDGLVRIIPLDPDAPARVVGLKLFANEAV